MVFKKTVLYLKWHSHSCCEDDKKVIECSCDMCSNFEKSQCKKVLFYFGKTSRCKSYKSYTGSGKYWTNHYKKYGKKYIKTLKVGEFDTEQECVDFAIWFSKMNNIVKCKRYANLKEENGLDGGGISKICPHNILGVTKCKKCMLVCGRIYDKKRRKNPYRIKYNKVYLKKHNKKYEIKRQCIHNKRKSCCKECSPVECEFCNKIYSKDSIKQHIKNCKKNNKK